VSKKIVFKVTGGLGRNIAALAVARQIIATNAGCTLHVMASYPDVFVGVAGIEKVYPFPAQNTVMPDWFENHRDFDVLEAEPYVDLGYRNGEQHLVDVWCRRLGIGLPDRKFGDLSLHDGSEREWARRNLAGLFQASPRPKLIAFQPWGGTSFYDAGAAMDPTRPKQARDLPFEIAQTIVNKLRERGFVVLQMSLPTERQLQNVIPIPVAQGQVINPRYLFALLELCDGLVTIDSFSAHAWVALEKKNAVVLWGATNPTNLGYSCNNNISKDACKTPHCNRPETHMLDVLGNGQPWRCPHKDACMNHDPEQVAQAVIGSQQCQETKHQ